MSDKYLIQQKRVLLKTLLNLNDQAEISNTVQKKSLQIGKKMSTFVHLRMLWVSVEWAKVAPHLTFTELPQIYLMPAHPYIWATKITVSSLYWLECIPLSHCWGFHALKNGARHLQAHTQTGSQRLKWHPDRRQAHLFHHLLAWYCYYVGPRNRKVNRYWKHNGTYQHIVAHTRCRHLIT